MTTLLYPGAPVELTCIFVSSMSREAIFRSAPMALVQFYVASEAARDVVGALGMLDCVDFRDLNANASNSTRSYVSAMRGLDETIRIMDELILEVASSGLELSDQRASLHEPLGPAGDIDEIREQARSASERIGKLAAFRADLAHKRDVLLERRYVLRSCDTFFMPKDGAEQKDEHAIDTEDHAPLLMADEFSDDPEVALHRVSGPPLIAGTIAREKYSAFERLCWRVSRGNLFLKNFTIDESISGVWKDVFVCYSHGDVTNQRIKRVAESLDAYLVVVDQDSELRQTEIEGCNNQLVEVFTIYDQATESLAIELSSLKDSLSLWKALVLKEKATYEVLNRFNLDPGRRSLIAEAWVPRDELEHIRTVLHQFSGTVLHEIQTNMKPPTFHRTNKVTQAFQAMVDIYGIGRYQEVNPGLPTVVTFPFMFAVMFGDMGHGLIVSLAAIYLIIRERYFSLQKREEIFDMAFTGRYVLLFMGLFSIYTGFCYNDVFSRPVTLFRSGWGWPRPAEPGSTVTAGFHHAYYFGIDPSWHSAENNLLFLNSYKMKLSVLLGFAHMTYSLVFQYVNARYFNSWVDTVGNFIPGMVFMQSIFGYLSLAIVYKWCVDWSGREAPGLLTMLIDMFLSPGKIETPLYKGQKIVQIVLLLAALVCIPWLLLFKPLYLRRQNKLAQAAGYRDLYSQAHDSAIFVIEEEAGDLMAVQALEGPQEEFEFGEIIVHQVIHTIEFCLNCVSHTASYLRLWALSLAHNQLSSVLWDMTIANAFGPTGAKGVVMVVCLFAMWFVITVLVLVCMEGTSAMLHSLRLHWVEAMSKHFEGEGIAFEPFSYSKLEENL